MSAVEKVKRFLPVIRVISSGRMAADEMRARREERDLVTRLNALGNAIVAVTGAILLIRELKKDRSS